MAAIETRAAAKRFGPVRALQDVSISVPEGSIFGFLGPNGAGKTTLLRALMGLTRLDAGEASVLGMDPWSDRVRLHAQLGYLPGGMGMHDRMRGIDVLDHAAALTPGPGRRSPLRDHVLDALELGGRDLQRPVAHYSKGMRQMVAITQALQHDPSLVLMDEPSQGLDPLVQHAMYDLLRERSAAGRTIFFSSHTLSEVELLCDHVAFIRGGTIVVQAPLEELAGRRARMVHVACDDPDALSGLGAGFEPLADDHAGRRVFRTELPAPELLDALATVGPGLRDVLVREPTLDDLFRSYYGSEDAR